jgi:hypothetical protein
MGDSASVGGIIEFPRYMCDYVISTGLFRLARTWLGAILELFLESFTYNMADDCNKWWLKQDKGTHASWLVLLQLSLGLVANSVALAYSEKIF